MASAMLASTNGIRMSIWRVIDMHSFKVGDRVDVSECCRGTILELYESAVMIEVDVDGDVIYVEVDELQPVEEVH